MGWFSCFLPEWECKSFLFFALGMQFFSFFALTMQVFWHFLKVSGKETKKTTHNLFTNLRIYDLQIYECLKRTAYLSKKRQKINK